jgi:SAM-dependent methyltransferase
MPPLMSPRPRIDTWVTTPEQISEVFSVAVADSLTARGRDIDDAATQATVRTNTVLVPARADLLLSVMKQLLGMDSLQNLRVLEVGSGYGALAAQLTWSQSPASLVGIDTEEEYVELASRCASELKLDAVLSYRKGDMCDLGDFADDDFDVVLANNSFLYVTERRRAHQALSEFHRVLSPGGVIVLYQANLWRWREPFTGDPIMHLLPPGVATLVSRMTGLRHNHGRVRLLSPVGARRSLTRAGFDATVPVSFRQGPVTAWPRRNFGTFFGIAGRRAPTKGE